VDSGQVLILDPPPEVDMDNAIQVTLSVDPSRFTCKVPIEFLEKWGEDIAYGALSKIHLQMNTKHYAPQQAAYFQKMWETALKRMRGQQFINYVPGDEKINTAGILKWHHERFLEKIENFYSELSSNISQQELVMKAFQQALFGFLAAFVLFVSAYVVRLRSLSNQNIED
jgi:hypothetical protein